MFICRSCARRATSDLLRRLPAAESRLPVSSRTFATASTRRLEQTDKTSWDEFETSKGKDHAPNGKKQAQGDEAALKKMQRAVKKELELTTDPYHLAANVEAKLRDDQFEKALMLTQGASKDKQVVVCWNHLIEYLFKQQKVHAAIKLYNDMKKRAQLPNVQTYTIIFNGCAESNHPKQAVNEALKIFNSMLSSTRLKPNTIHLNAVLDVCARAQDLESLFVTLRSASGLRAPNNLTYTIILNALRYQPDNAATTNDDSEERKRTVRASIQTTIERARLVWDEVMKRWEDGEILMDEELMCAMGRVLLLGGAKQTDAVLRIVCDVLGIEKLLDGGPALIQEDDHKAASKSKQPRIIEKASENTQNSIRGTQAKPLEDLEDGINIPESAEDYSSKRPQTESLATRISAAQLEPKAVAKIAGNNTLSLVMRALANDYRTKLAARWWDFMTFTYSVVPDQRNYRDYLACLATGAASGKATRMLLSVPPHIADPNLYRRGLLLCHFDAFNDNAFDNATAIFDAMVKRLRIPDARCLKLYLQVAVSSQRKFQKKHNYPNMDNAKLAYGMQIFTALDRVFEPLRRVTNDMTFLDDGRSSSEADAALHLSAMYEDTMEVARKFALASDKMLSESLIPKTYKEHKIIVYRLKTMREFIKRQPQTNRARLHKKMMKKKDQSNETEQSEQQSEDKHEQFNASTAQGSYF